MNDATSIEKAVVRDPERPFYKYQEQGYFPWEASFEGRTVGQEIMNIFHKIPDIQAKDQEALFDFFKSAMKLSAHSYVNSFDPDRFKPVYHGTNPNAGTPEALRSKYCGHQEASSLFGSSLYVGACLKGDLKFNPTEFKAIALASLIHENLDWYIPKDLSQFFSETTELVESWHVPNALLSFLLQVNRFGQWPEETIPASIEDKIAALKEEGYEIQIKPGREGNKLEDFDGEGIRRLTILAGIVIAADWSQCINNRYLTDSNGPRCLADEFNELRPKAKLAHWYKQEDPSQTRSFVVGTDREFYEKMILRGLSYCDGYLDAFYGGQSPLPTQISKLETNVHIVEARKAIAPAFEEK